MDGRAHPPDYVAHTWQGFSTAKLGLPHAERDHHPLTTTNLKMGYIRRNGVARSDRARVTEHFIRHRNYLTIVSIVTDPVYLTEPFIRSSDYLLDETHVIPPYPCKAVVEVERGWGAVPHHLPGTNPFLSEFPAKCGLPAEAARGGGDDVS